MTQTRRRNNKENDRFLLWGFFALLVWLPLPLGSNRAWAWHLLELASFTLVIVWLVLFLKDRVQTSTALKNSQWLLGSLLAFAAVMLLQLLPLPSGLIALLRPVNPELEPSQWLQLSVDVHITWIHLRTTLAYTGLAFLTLSLINSQHRLRLLALTLLVSGVGQAIYGSLMTLSGIEYGFLVKKTSYFDVATGTFVNRNHLANYLILCLSMGTGLLLADLYQKSAGDWRERGRRLLTSLLGNKARVRVGLALMVIALVLTRSRMGNTAFFLSLLASGFIWLWLTRRITRGSIILLLSLVLIDSLIVGAWFGFDKVIERVEGSAFSKETRDEVNRDSLPLIKDHLLLGAGAGSFYGVFPQYRQQDIPLNYNHAHNDYAQMLAEHGLLGVLPLLCFIFACLKNVIATMRERKTLLFQAMAFAPMMSVFALILHSTVEFNLQIPALAGTLIVIMSLAWVVRHLPSKERRRR